MGKKREKKKKRCIGIHGFFKNEKRRKGERKVKREGSTKKRKKREVGGRVCNREVESGLMVWQLFLVQLIMGSNPMTPKEKKESCGKGRKKEEKRKERTQV